MDQLSAMRAFVRVVEAGNFTRAAETLRMPKATLTNLIQGLENHLQTKLLNRTTRRVFVTTDGALYYERAVQLVAEIDELDSSLSHARANPSGRLRVEMPGAFADWFVIPSLHEFHADYPDIQLDLGVGDRTADYLKENVDCALRGGEPQDQSLIARKVAELEMVTCAAPDYLEKYGVPPHPSALGEDHFCVNYFGAQSGQIRDLLFTRGAEEVTVRTRHRIAVNDGRSFVLAAIQGHGVGRVPRFMAQDALQTGALVPVLEDWDAEPIPLYIVYPPSRHLSNKVRVFVDWLIRLLADVKRRGFA